MKLFVLLVVTLVALCGVVLATKEQDYQAYKSAERTADAKRAQCSKYAQGNCATIAECDDCAACLTEVTNLYKTAVAMRRAYTKKWFNGKSDAGHTQWEQGLTSANNSRVQMANKCKGTKKILVARQKKEEEERRKREEEEKKKMGGAKSPTAGARSPVKPQSAPNSPRKAK
ncbi:hypothetical protein GQ42DRAFT_163301 [Ramicandelaber brevisporus]|nr:hypothetical protein GQ42DRAFT_163301 [Ramicandelaber brevisporus]